MQSTLCYIEQQGKYLMLYRNKKPNDLNEGKWLGVGGKFEAGETPLACMMREVREETGFVPTQWQARGMVEFRCDVPNADEDMYLYTVTAFEVADAPVAYDESGLPVPECDEGTFAWIPKGELGALPMWEGDALFLSKIAVGDTDIRMAFRYEGDTLVSAEEVMR